MVEVLVCCLSLYTDYLGAGAGASTQVSFSVYLSLLQFYIIKKYLEVNVKQTSQIFLNMKNTIKDPT